MSLSDDIDRLLLAYCEGMYAMDPRTTYPFWDYDMAPLFSAAWVEKILAAARATGVFDPADAQAVLGGPSVAARKELIYSLVDLKVARIPVEERLGLVSFWIDLLRAWCGADWLSSSVNRAPNQDRPDELLGASHWVDADRTSGVAVGRMIVSLNALTYGLYSDVFAHQCGECRGPYEVPDADGLTLLVRAWAGLRPTELDPAALDPGCNEIVVVLVYENCPCAIDIYNHVTWRASPVDHLRHYAVWLGGCEVRLSPAELDTMAHRVAAVAKDTFRRCERKDFEQRKVQWVRQRNHQFRRWFDRVGLAPDADDMLADVRGRDLWRSPLWNMQLPKDELFGVWSTCLDPRNDVYADDWTAVFTRVFGDVPRP